MELLLQRFQHGKDSTAGLLFLDGQFECFTVEDEYREVKVMGETRIPDGSYQIELRRNSPMANRYMRRFKDHPGMLWLKNVPGFQYVYIHIGNTADDTMGCILVGDSCDTHLGECRVGQSADAYYDLYVKVRDELRLQRLVYINVTTSLPGHFLQAF